MSDLITLKIRRNEKWTHLFLGAVEDRALSWAAKGLHTYLISRPPGWQIRYSDLLSRSKNGRTALKSFCRELKFHGYLFIEKARDGTGKFSGTIWTVHETPRFSPQERFPSCGKTDGRQNRRTESVRGNTNHDYSSLKKTTTTKTTGDNVVALSTEIEEYTSELIAPLLQVFNLPQAVASAHMLVRSNQQLPAGRVWHAVWVLAWQVKKNNFHIKTTWEDVIEGILRKGVRHPIGCPTPTEVLEKRRRRVTSLTKEKGED